MQRILPAEQSVGFIKGGYAVKVQITYNGKTVDVELTEEQMKELGLRNNKTGWERVENGNIYNYINDFGEIRSVRAVNNGLEKECREYGNYFSDKSLAELMAKAIGLYLRMRRWADEHNTSDCIECKYAIWYDSLNDIWNTTVNVDVRHPFEIYFDSEKIAKQAILEFQSELEKVFVNGLWHLGGDNND